MAAAAAAAIGSSFTSSMHTLKSMRASAKHHWPSVLSPDHNNKIATPLMMKASSISQPQGKIEPLYSGAITPQGKWRMLKISGAVAQEEAAATADAATTTEEAETETETEAEGVQEDGELTKAEPHENKAPAPLGVSTKLYFGNLPYNVDSAQLAGIIQDYGSPELVEVLYDRETGRSRGFAFVTMSTTEDCNAVIENLDGKEYFGRILRVNFSDKPRPKVPLYSETDYKLFVGNLSWSVTTESLTEAFQECGNVVGARVLYDGESGRSRGYGFVCYSTKEEMDTALESLDGVELEGRAMRVSMAQGRR